MIKFSPSYQLSLTPNHATVPVGPQLPILINFPSTIDIHIEHTLEAASNVCELSVHGLSATHRRQITYNLPVAPALFPLTLRAGYVSQLALGVYAPASSLPVIFSGFGRIAYTERVGCDLVTRINALDNGNVATATQNRAFLDGSPENSYSAPVGSTFQGIARSLMSLLRPGIQEGQIVIEDAVCPGPIKGKPRVFTGDVWEALKKFAEEAGAKVFVENGVCHMLSQNSVLRGPSALPEISSATGLLDVPRFTDQNVECLCVFEPRLVMGTLVNLKSSVTPWINGKYKVIQYTHAGTISGSQASTMTTKVNLQKLDQPYYPL